MQKHKLVITIIAIVIIIVIINILSRKPATPVINKEVNQEYILTPQPGLPAAVEAKRQAIYKAAREQSYEALAKEIGPQFFYSFGGEYEGGFIEYLKLSQSTEGESVFEIIPTLLRLPYAERDGLYTWPVYFTQDPATWTEEDIQILRTFLSQELIDSYRKNSGYLYYRIGIKSDGSWTFYIAGD